MSFWQLLQHRWNQLYWLLPFHWTISAMWRVGICCLGNSLSSILFYPGFVLWRGHSSFAYSVKVLHTEHITMVSRDWRMPMRRIACVVVWHNLYPSDRTIYSLTDPSPSWTFWIPLWRYYFLSQIRGIFWPSLALRSLLSNAFPWSLFSPLKCY